MNGTESSCWCGGSAYRSGMLAVTGSKNTVTLLSMLYLASVGRAVWLESLYD